MIRLECDYAEGAHPKILQRLLELSAEQNPGYGEDPHCASAADLIRQECGRQDLRIRFLVGGTQANTAVITACLKPYQGVISADAGHIAVHETGAVEAYGHKVLSVQTVDGKLTAEQIDFVCRSHWEDVTHAHQVQPGMVYLSFPTENGLLYSKKELSAIAEACRRWRLPLFVDGARLGYGIVSPASDVTLRDLASLCDVFTIGGTKVGALFGEAVVICSGNWGEEFPYLIKQHGAMLAKGWLLGVQFETLFEGGLYWEISRHAVDLALLVRSKLYDLGIPMLCDSMTNQQFPILADRALSELEKEFAFSHWGRSRDGRTPVRICTSWATERGAVEHLIERLVQYSGAL